MGMTREELSAFIKSEVAPMIKGAIGGDGGKEIAELVRENVERSIGELRKDTKGGWSEKLFANGDEKKEKMPQGTAFARCLRAVAAAKMGGYGPDKAIDILKGWGDGELADAWTATRQKALGTGDPTAGGFLVPTTFSSDLIELLRPAAVVRSMNPTTIPMPNGTVKIPKVTTGVTASYIGENANLAKGEERFGQLTLTWKKLGVLVPISNDLIRYSSPSADAVVRDDVVRAMAQREDQAFIRDDGTSGTPRGLKSWINPANVYAANQTVNLANVTIDLGKAIQNLMAANIPMIIAQQQGFPNQTGGDARCGWIFSPRTYRYLTTLQNANGWYVFRDEMLKGSLWGFPFRITTQVQETLTSTANTVSTNSEIYFGAFAHAVIGEALGVMVDASQEAAYYDGSSVQAAFSQDQTVIRVLAEHDFALRYDKAFTLVSSVLWGT
jgi:HK97 family phage major capsid protein